VTGPYQFDSKNRIVGPRGNDDLYPHQVPVDWETNFAQVEIFLGAEQPTVLKLTGDRLHRLEEVVRKVSNKVEHVEKSNQEAVLEALEGWTYRAETAFRKRNRALIEA